MKEIDKKCLDLSVKLFDELPSQQIKPFKLEDISGEIERILSKVLKNKNIKVNGNGLTEPINVEIKDEKKVED